MKHVITQQITLIMCHLLFQALLREARLLSFVPVRQPSPAAILPLWAFKGWKPAVRMVRMAGQKRRGAWGSDTATSYSASLGNNLPCLLYKRKGKWPDFLVSPPYIMPSVLIILKYIVCVIFFCYCCFSLLLYSSWFIWRFYFFAPTGCLYNYDFTLHALTFTAWNGVCYYKLSSRW